MVEFGDVVAAALGVGELLNQFGLLLPLYSHKRLRCTTLGLLRGVS